MSTHSDPDDPPFESWIDHTTAPQSPGRPQVSPALMVVLAIVGGLTLILLALILTGNAEQAESVAILAMMMGTGLAIGFRKRWTR